MLNRQDSRLVDLLYSACRDGVYELLPIDASDFEAIGDIRKRYHDLGLDFADAALMHLAERESIGTVFTLDRRDFSVFRTSTGKQLTLIPEF